jgi:drug/metabolite transporter (DMT)-like permease
MERVVVDRKQALDIVAMAMLAVLCVSWGVQQVAIKQINPAAHLLQSGSSRPARPSCSGFDGLCAGSPFEADGTLGWELRLGPRPGVSADLLGSEFTSASCAVVFLYIAPLSSPRRTACLGERLRAIQVIGLGCAFTGIAAAFRESLSS